ncbi:hypothetical protein BCD48_16745 [Pseudofrankia sp. BMG5.36]|nr:hypothetical protein BCD48_16745 [Pseudofrankia sp. BMG5.36]
MVSVTPDELLASARETTGLDDFGDDELFGGDGWRDGLDVLLKSLENDGRLTEFGQVAVAGELGGYLANRLRIVAHHRAYPEIRERDVASPVVIIGQARTGTTMLFDVLAQDPAHRAPLTWEVEAPLPPPRTETYETDPRIAQTEELIGLVDLFIPEFRSIHQLGAGLAQECGRITGSAFTSAIFATQYRVPGYLRWWLHDAVRDGHVAASYTWHRRFLELLQSEHPGTRWLVKSPAHVWTLPQLMAEYPGALLVQTHRDPARIMASTASMLASLRRLYTDDVDATEISEEFAELILDGLDRTVDARLDGTVPAGQVIDLQFAGLMDDALGAARAVYDQFGFELPADTAARMTRFARDYAREPHGHQYTFADTGMDLDELRARTARYTKYFAVTEEAV